MPWGRCDEDASGLGCLGVAVTRVLQALGALFYRFCLKSVRLRSLFAVIVAVSSLIQVYMSLQCDANIHAIYDTT